MDRRQSLRISAFFIACLLNACVTAPTFGWTLAETDPDWKTGTLFRLKGTVRWQALEGGFFAIIGETGTRYEPTNLPERFAADGYRIEADVRAIRNYVSVTMSGPGIQIVRIRRAGGFAHAGLGASAHSS